MKAIKVPKVGEVLHIKWEDGSESDCAVVRVEKAGVLPDNFVTGGGHVLVAHPRGPQRVMYSPISKTWYQFSRH